MRERLDVAPTKSVLLALRRQLEFLEEGHALLERKKELLTRLVYKRLAQYRQVRNEAREAGACLVVNTDTHTPGDMIDQAFACRVASAAGLDADEVYAATVTHPQALVRRALARLESLAVE